MRNQHEAALDVRPVAGGNDTGTALRPAVAYSERFDQAVILASLAHEGVPRKGTAFPYIMHPVHVARLLERHGFSEDVAIAGLLHDVLEDARFGDPALQKALKTAFCEFAETEPTENAFRITTETLIASRFGPVVLELVRAVTEVKTDGATARPWRVRKDEQLAHIPQMSRDAAALKAADTLHNAQSILSDVRRSHLDVWSRFNCSPEDTLWQYRAVADALRNRLSMHPLALELDEAVSRLTEAVEKLLSPSSPAASLESSLPS